MAVERRTCLFATVALCASLAGCDAPTTPRESFAYDPTQLTGGKLYHWALGKTIAVFVDPIGQSASEELTGAVGAGAEAWESGVYYREFRLRIVDAPGDADVIVHSAPAWTSCSSRLSCAFASRTPTKRGPVFGFLGFFM